jgi:hypothetical protein
VSAATVRAPAVRKPIDWKSGGILLGLVSYGSPTLAEVTGVGKGIAGALFGVVLSAIALVLPTRPGEPRRASARRTAPAGA